MVTRGGDEDVPSPPAFLTGEASRTSTPALPSCTAVQGSSSGPQQRPNRDDSTSSTVSRGLKRTAECQGPYSNEAKQANGCLRCLLCNINTSWSLWTEHAAEKRHCDRLEEQRRGERPPIDHQQLIHPPVPIYELMRVREDPCLLLYLKAPRKSGLDEAVAEPVRRWVMEGIGIKESAACELRAAMLTSLASLVSVEDQRFHLISDSFTDSIGGVALANITGQFTKPASDQIGDPYHYSFSPFCLRDGSSRLVVRQAPHIAALAQLAPHATELRVNSISLCEAAWFHQNFLLWLAACRLLLSSLRRLPHPPQQISIRFPNTDDAPGSAGEFALFLLAQTELHTLLDNIEIEAWRSEHASELHAAAPAVKWVKATCQTVRDIRTLILLGTYRSTASPLRLLPPVLLPRLLEHIKPCSLSIKQSEETEWKRQEVDRIAEGLENDDFDLLWRLEEWDGVGEMRS